jgi:5-methylcytosine-specific restriction endonuclease McrA
MTRYRFSPAERHAVYTVHGEKCYMCGAALTMKTCEVDHIIPESLKDRPEDLRRVLKQLGLEETFDLNSYLNWMPSCRRCNSDKSDFVLEQITHTLVLLQRAKTRAPKAEKFARRLVTDRKIYKAINVLEQARWDGELSDEAKAQLMPLISYQRESREEALKQEPIHVSAMYDVGDENQWIQLTMEHLVRSMAKNLKIEVLLFFESDDDVHVTAHPSPNPALVAVFDAEVRNIARGRGKSIQISWAKPAGGR